MEQTAPLEFGEVYYQKKAQAVRDLESVFTLFIPFKGDTNNIELDSVYFKGKSAKLMLSPQNQNLYFGRFITPPKYVEDLILSSDIKEEHQNQLPKIESKTPFELKHNECIIRYMQHGEVKYYKILNIKEKRLREVPMSPRNKP
ncbi:hypothetical protein ACS386_02880 [Flavobacteriaceae bacterium LMO-SS05]